MNSNQKVRKRINYFEIDNNDEFHDENDFANDNDVSIHVEFAVYLCNSNRFNKFQIWFDHLSKYNPPLLIDLMKAEDFCMCIVRLRFFQKKYEHVVQLLETGPFSAREEYIKLWEDAHYKRKEETIRKPLTPLQRFRIRKKFPPPANICPYGRQIINPLFKQASVTMKRWFQEHSAHPYPTILEKQNMAQQTGLTLYQVKTWFANTRRRQKLRQMQSGLPCPNLLSKKPFVFNSEQLARESNEDCPNLLNKKPFVFDSKQLARDSNEALDLSIQNLEKKDDQENVLMDQESWMDGVSGLVQNAEKADLDLSEECPLERENGNGQRVFKKSHRCCLYCPEFGEAPFDPTDPNPRQFGLVNPNDHNGPQQSGLWSSSVRSARQSGLLSSSDHNGPQQSGLRNSTDRSARQSGLLNSTHNNCPLLSRLLSPSDHSAQQSRLLKSTERNPLLSKLLYSTDTTRQSGPSPKTETFSNMDLGAELSNKQKSTTEPNSSVEIEKNDLFKFLQSASSSLVTMLTNTTQTQSESACPNPTIYPLPVLPNPVDSPVNLAAFRQDGRYLPTNQNSFNHSVLLSQGIENAKCQDNSESLAETAEEGVSYSVYSVQNVTPSCSSEYTLQPADGAPCPTTGTVTFAVISLPNTSLLPQSSRPSSATSINSSHHLQIIPASNLQAVQINNEGSIQLPRSCDASPSTSHNTLTLGTSVSQMSRTLEGVTGTDELMILETAHTLLRLSRKRE